MVILTKMGHGATGGMYTFVGKKCSILVELSGGSLLHPNNPPLKSLTLVYTVFCLWFETVKYSKIR